MAETIASTENKLGSMPVRKLIFNMSLPIIASMLLNAFYNVVDSIFVARVSEDALTAVSLAFPVQNLMIAFATGTGVGFNALLSRRLGQKNQKAANEVANAGVLLCVITSIIFAVLGSFLSRAYFGVQKGINEAIFQYGVDYLSVVTIGSIGLFLSIAEERILQGTGRSLMTMYIQGTGAIINIILDPILIFGLFGFPRMEVKGAALATIIGQLISAVLGYIFNLKYNSDIRISVKTMFPVRFDLFKEIYKIGFPSICMAAVNSLTNFLMNQILLSFTSTAAAVFGVFFKLNSMCFMPLFGLNNGLVPIVAYNYGARRRGRILKAIKIAIIFGTCIMAVGCAMFELIPDKLFALFNASPEMLAIGVPAFRIIGWTFLFAAFSIISGSVFQALGRSIFSLFISLGRQIVVLIPVAYLFSLSGDLHKVWFAFPIAEVVCVTIAAIFLRHVLKMLNEFDV